MSSSYEDAVTSRGRPLADTSLGCFTSSQDVAGVLFTGLFPPLALSTVCRGDEFGTRKRVREGAQIELK